jgi:hypothetical protein
VLVGIDIEVEADKWADLRNGSEYIEEVPGIEDDAPEVDNEHLDRVNEQNNNFDKELPF